MKMWRYTSPAFMVVVFLLSMFLFPHRAFAVDSFEYGWTQTFEGSSDYETGTAATTDGDGNVYLTGYFFSTTDFDPGTGTDNRTSNGNSDIFVTKYDTDGTYAWTKTVGGTSGDQANAIVTDSSGNVYITGFFQSTVDFDPGAGTDNRVSAGSRDLYVLKLNSSGTFVWADTIGNSGADYAQGIALDSSDNVYYTGVYTGTVDFDPSGGTDNHTMVGTFDFFTSKLTSSGGYVWTNTVGGTAGDVANGISIDDSNNIYVVGSTIDSVDFDPSGGTDTHAGSASGSDMFITKYSSAGAYGWTKSTSISAGNSSGAFAAINDSNNNVYATGTYTGTVDFDPTGTTENHTSNGSSDLFISKFSSAGTYIWTQTIGSTGNDRVKSIIADESDNLYIAGNFVGTLDFDPGAGSTSRTAVADDYAAFISSYTSAGLFRFVHTFNSTCVCGYDGSSVYGTLGYDVATNSLYATGEFGGTTDFDPLGSNDSFTTDDNWSGFLIKLFTVPQPVPSSSPSPSPSSSSSSSSSSSNSSSSTGEVTAGAAELLRPASRALVSNKPAFAWSAPAEPQNVESYKLLIDGTVVFSGLPTQQSRETSEYILVFQPSTNDYLLQLKNPLSDGTHTWSIQSVSTTGKVTGSIQSTFIVNQSIPLTTTFAGLASTSADNVAFTTFDTDSTLPSRFLRDNSISTEEDTRTSNRSPLSGIFTFNLGALLTSLSNALARSLESLISSVKAAAPVIPAAVTAAVVMTMAGFLAIQLGGELFSPKILFEALKGFGLFAQGNPQGAAFETSSMNPVAFAVITLFNQDKSIYETIVTDVHGIYRGVKLPLGSYQMVAAHQDYHFPTTKDRPPYLTIRDFYQGQEFSVSTQKQNQLFMIPMDSAVQSKNWLSFKAFFGSLASWWLHHQLAITIIFSSGSALMTYLAPTLLNAAFTITYTLLLVRKILRLAKTPLLSGRVTGPEQQPMANTIIRFSDAQDNQLRAVVQADQKGKYQAYIDPGNYQMAVIQPGYVWPGSSGLSFQEHRIDEPSSLDIPLVRASF